MESFKSLLFTLGHQHRVTSLTLIDCSTGPRDETERAAYRANLERETALPEAQRGAGFVTMFASDGAYRRLEAKEPEAGTSYLERLREQSVEGAIRTLKTVHWNRLSLFEKEHELQNCHVPTLLIYGMEDHPLVQPNNDFLATNLQRSKVVAVAQTGKFVHVENAPEVSEELKQHFAKEN